LSAGLGIFAALVCAQVGLGLVPLWAIGLLVAFVAYSAINSGIDTRVGNVIVGLAVTAALSYALAVHYLASGYLFGIFGAVA
ncbi:hypothetical protein ABTH93_20760, partial [Acinetobacter baumannii]